VKNLFNLELEDPSPTVFYICCELMAIELEKYSRKKCAYLEKVRERHAKAKKVVEPRRLSNRLHQPQDV